MQIKNRLDQLFADAVAGGKVPGVIATVGDRDGVIYEGAFGDRAPGGDKPMCSDSIAWLASMSKAITSVAAVQLVERGRLDLDAPATEWVPQIGEAQVLTGFDADGRPTFRPPRRPVTLRHLLTHTAGFSYEIWNTDIQKVQAAFDIPGITDCRNKSLTTPLLFDPGEGWDYGIGIDWAGRMIEAVSGVTLGQFLAKNLFEPLGMTDTAFRISPAMRERLAAIYLRDDQGRLAPFAFEIPQEPEFQMGGGGLYGTAGDYLLFLRMLLNGGQLAGERVLRPETVALLGMNHAGSNRVTKLKAAIPLTNDAEFFPGIAKSWSLAFQINDAPAPTGRPAGGLMWAGLANSYYWLDQASGLAGVYVTQIFPFADHGSLPLYYDFESTVYSALR